jgi:hypothetical protein
MLRGSPDLVVDEADREDLLSRPRGVRASSVEVVMPAQPAVVDRRLVLTVTLHVFEVGRVRSPSMHMALDSAIDQRDLQAALMSASFDCTWSIFATRVALCASDT